MRFTYGTPDIHTQDELRIELANPRTLEVWCHLDGVVSIFEVPVADMMKLLGVKDGG